MCSAVKINIYMLTCISYHMQMNFFKSSESLIRVAHGLSRDLITSPISKHKKSVCECEREAVAEISCKWILDFTDQRK